ncbi:flagellar hook-associated protein FlgK [Pallidibacillus thermolactis]|uniref:flagellar hook-associated protein FlgK n=1 Tax=Pallidibacillus thermolactis TaxID=251051 RepID=UPI002E1FB1C1|nr:flagellar hook-associated protein FlgK [Pallidibacillus thermolactis]MED1672236.1 flagellar hook-associated protein FlgK [Pallidibacillus thermolactis subsp. kokeshiiformis]
MVSTFHGLETAKRALTASQSALYTTGHNISNANTQGYTRQRVDFRTTNPYNAPYGQIGTGVEPGQVIRIRENYLDVQYRTEYNKFGYYSSISQALAKMEDIIHEPSDTGLQAVMDKFWNSLQDLANNPQNSATRQVVASNGKMFAETLNYYSNSLVRIQSDLGQEIDVKVGEINAIISQIDELNKQIATVEPHGKLPNDLYDRRDLLVDELSKLINIEVDTVIPQQYGQPSKTAVGLYEIRIVGANGSDYGDGIKLLEVNNTTGRSSVNKLEVTTKDNGLNKPVNAIKVNGKEINNLGFGGQLGGIIKSYGYQLPGEVGSGYYPEMLENLNKLTFAFAMEFNNIHTQGYGLNSDEKAQVFFDLGNEHNIDRENATTDDLEKAFEYNPEINYAQIIKVNEAIIENPSLIAAASEKGGFSGDNDNAFELANIFSKDFSEYFTETVNEFDEEGNVIGIKENKYGSAPSGLNGSFASFYAGLVGDLGVDAQSAVRNQENVQVLVDSVDYNRKSVSGVSLDEEITNLVTFQHAYNASARMITVIDEMLDRIINSTGIVGR